MSPRLSLLLALALAAAGCVSKAAKAPAAAEERPITFPHSTHVDSGVECKECHSGIEKAVQLEPDKIHLAFPAKSDLCSGCHEKIPAAPKVAFQPSVNFNHAFHLPLVKNECARCHKKLPEPGMTQDPVPAMSACTSCHNHQKDYAQARCTPCHLDLRRFPLKPVSDFVHEGDFLKTHGQMARTNVQTCSACHDQTKCAECHTATTNPMKPDVRFPERVNSDFIHRGDFISRHQIEAAADPASCRRCHGSGYCQGCHTMQGLTINSTSIRDPHPSSWLAGSPSQHGIAARQNIVMCAGCHDQGQNANCVACHSTRSPSHVNPHPPGWASKNPASKISGNSMCRICH